MFDLQRRGRDLRVSQQIHDQHAPEIADPDRFGQTLGDQPFHPPPRLLDAGVAPLHLFPGGVVVPAGGVAFLGIDVLEGDGEVHDEEVEVVDSPVAQLLFADGFDVGLVVEGVPEFGDDEEVGAFAEAVFEGAGDALAAFGFVAVVWEGGQMLDSGGIW